MSRMIVARLMEAREAIASCAGHCAAAAFDASKQATTSESTRLAQINPPAFSPLQASTLFSTEETGCYYQEAALTPLPKANQPP